MKFLEKVKNMFTEEVEEEVKPIKTEVRKVEIPAPIKTTTDVSTVEKNSENESVQKEEKFKFPVYFDDKDFDKLPSASEVEKKEEPKKVVPKPKQPVREPVRKEAYGGKNPAFSATAVKEDKKTFRPTPIISPVYGVLDKNYKKDDITPKKRVTEPRSSSKALTVDDIRNKAFGTLEDDLETTLFGKNSILFNDENENSKEDEAFDLFDELDMKMEEEPRHGKIEETVTPSRVQKNRELELMDEVDDLENLVINERPSLDSTLEKKEPVKEIVDEPSVSNMIEDEMDKICSEKVDDDNDAAEELTESDLFSLIDSMYEKKDGEE